MEKDNTVRRVNKKMMLILVVVFLAVCSVAAVGLLYVLNKGRRQEVLLESAGKYMAAKDYSRAILQYKRALSLGNATGDMYFKYGCCLEKLKQGGPAFYAFERAATLDENHAEARKRIAGTYYQRAAAALAQPDADPGEVKPLQKLEACARTLMRLQPSDRAGYVWLARAQRLKGEDEEALKTLGRGLEKLPDDGGLIAEKVRILLRAERVKEAEAEARRALERRPDSAELLLAFADLCEKTERPAEMESALTKLLASDPKNVEGRRRLAFLYWRQGKSEEAEREFRRACDLQPEATDAWVALSRFLSSVNEPKKALESLEKGCAMNPEDMGLLVELTRMEVANDKLSEARGNLERLKKMKAAPAVLAWLEGRIELADGNVTPARSKFLEAIRKSNVEFSDAYYGLGLCYLREGNYGAAEEQLMVAARSRRLRRRAWLGLADVYLRAGRTQDALAQAARIEELSQGARTEAGEKAGRDAAALLIMGQAYFREGEMEKAARCFEDALAADSADSLVRLRALTLLGRLSLARRGPAVRRGDEAEAAKRLKEAIEYVRKAREVEPNDANVLMLDARLADLAGDKGKAAEIIKSGIRSPQAAARFIREAAGGGKIFEGVEESAAMVKELVAAHRNRPEVLGAAVGYFALEGAVADARARRLRGAERDALLRSRDEHYKEAIECARKAFELDEGNPFHAVRLFQLCLTTGETEEARVLAVKLTSSKVTKPLGLALEGLLSQNEGKMKEAADKLKESIALNDNDWRTHYWLGRVYARMRGRAAEAEVELGRALQLRPTAAEARDLLFSVLEAQGKYDRIQAEIDELLKESAVSVAAMERSARLFEKSGEIEKAAERWKRIVDAVPADARACIEYSRVLRRLGRSAEAVQVAKKAVEVGKGSVPALRALVGSLLAMNDLSGAERVVREALESQPDVPSVYVLAGDLYRAMGRPAEAEANLKKLVEKRKEDAVSHFLLAGFLVRQGRGDEALGEYEEALRLEPDSLMAEMGIVNVLLSRVWAGTDAASKGEEIKRAAERIAEVKKRHPKSLSPRLAEASLLALQGKLDESEKYLEALAEEFEGSSALRVILARVYLRGGKTEEAADELRTALKENPQLGDAHVLLAQINVSRNRLRKAIEHCEEALRYQPTNEAALALSARIKQRLGDGSGAAADLRRIVKLKPSDRGALVRLLQSLFVQKREGEALEAAKEAYARNPSSSAFLEEYVRCLELAGKPDDAEVVCKGFLANHPESEAAWLMLGEAQFRLGRKDDAERSLQSAKRASKNSSLFLRRAVRVCVEAEEYERAIAFAKELARKAPDAVFANATLVDALQRAGRREEATRTAVEAARRNPDSAAFLQQAVRTLTDAKKTDEAISQCEAFLERHPGDATVSLMLADLQVASGRKEMAAATLKRMEEGRGSPLTPSAAVKLAQRYAALKRYEDAERVAKGLCERAPDSASAWLTYGSVVDLQGPEARERAIRIYEEGLGKQLRGEAARRLIVNNLAYALATHTCENPAEGKQALARASRLAESVLGDWETAPTFLLDTAGWIKFLRNESEEARELLALATTRPDAMPENWYHYAMACARTGNREGALKAVEKAVSLDPARESWVQDVKREISANEEEE